MRWLLILLISFIPFFISSCSYSVPFWINVVFQLDHCPVSNFEFPERVRSGEAFIAATDRPTLYCHGFTSFIGYQGSTTVDYFDFNSSKIPIYLISSIERTNHCKLNVFVRKGCPLNTREKTCFSEYLPKIDKNEIENTLKLYAKPLLHRSGATITNVEKMEFLTDSDLKDWCASNAKKMQEQVSF